MKNIVKSLLSLIKESRDRSNEFRLFSSRKLLLTLFVLLIILAFFSSYYHSLYQVEKLKYQRLEDAYVRLRFVLGEERAVELIKESYQYIDNTGKVIKN